MCLTERRSGWVTWLDDCSGTSAPELSASVCAGESR